MINKRLSLMIFLFAAIPTAFANDALKHDPFARPLLTTVLPTSTELGANIEQETPWNPSLTAVMVAGSNSLVTLDGVIMKLGEVKDGYRLVQVKDHEAVFKKGKKRVVLEMKIGASRVDSQTEAISTEPSLSRHIKEQGNTQ